MMMHFSDWLDEQARVCDSLLCVGLDPRGSNVAQVRQECFRIIDQSAEFAAAFKANSAFFEVFGAEGIAVLREVIAHVPNGVPVILDAKRGDIPDTARAYARAAFDTLGAHALTINPYLGHDAVQPFLERPEHGVFLLCRTSNPGSDEFQCLDTPSGALFEIVAQRAQEWNVNNNLGLVVGATDPAALARVRAIAPELWFLVPGVGTQGGDLGTTLGAGLRADGLGLLINVSRAIADAADPGAKARQLRDEINRLRTARTAPQATGMLTTLALDLFDSHCIQFGQFTLKSGVSSPIYVDLRRLVSHPSILQRVARAYANKLRELKFDRLVGIPYAALPIATAVALQMNRPLIYPRREAKEYGTRALIEGDYASGETVVVIDDLATTGGTKIETIQKLTSAGLVVHDIVVLIDREQGARESLAAAGYNLRAIVTLRQLLDELRDLGAISTEQFGQVVEYLKPT
jgi:uridine monophosphate synthetase